MNRAPAPLADAKAARAYCLRLLSRREYSAAKLRSKLRQRELPDEAIDQVLEALAKEGLQSDARCAEAVMRSAEDRGWSRRRTDQKLRQEGLDLRALPGVEAIDDDAERQRARLLFERWIAKTDRSHAAKQKVLARIARRGFPVGHLF